MIFSCASDSVRKPMRLAGTCSRYSNSAIPQLMIAATYHGRSARLRRCAYHAMVMKTFEQISSRMVGRAVIDGFYWWCDGANLRTTHSRSHPSHLPNDYRSYFQLRDLPEAIHPSAVVIRRWRVSSVFAESIQSM